jgi:hypothetical protein
MAMVPTKARPNDQIAILSGSPLPFVIRPTNDCYTLIGACYVYGIMDGEAFPGQGWNGSHFAKDRLDWLRGTAF